MENNNKLEQLSLTLIDIIKILKKRIVFIVFLTLLCTGVMVAKSIYFSIPMYQSYTTVVIVKGESNIIEDSQYTQNDVLLYQKIAETYVEIAKSNLVIDKTAKELKTYSAYQLKGMVNVAQMGGTQIIELTVTGSNRDVTNIANVYRNNFIKESTSILPVGTIEVLDKAKTSVDPVATNASNNIGIAFLFGLLTAIGIVFFRNYIDCLKIRNEKQIVSILNIPVLVTIS
ncbi:YveK family protein [Clostridium sp.]|uniref:YveK family protein n=1 Tax=Clostridium sp. TaxID=1506 RepID=UPI003D6CEFA7